MTLTTLSQIESQSSSVGMRNDRKLDDMIQVIYFDYTNALNYCLVLHLRHFIRVFISDILTTASLTAKRSNMIVAFLGVCEFVVLFNDIL